MIYNTSSVSLRDHPRACGEHVVLDDFLRHAEGSSPRLRGTLLTRGKAKAMRGIIPALAGNTVVLCHFNQLLGDHPRACGEHSKSGDIAPSHTLDHPRACGEHP